MPVKEEDGGCPYLSSWKAGSLVSGPGIEWVTAILGPQFPYLFNGGQRAGSVHTCGPVFLPKRSPAQSFPGSLWLVSKATGHLNHTESV